MEDFRPVDLRLDRWTRFAAGEQREGRHSAPQHWLLAALKRVGHLFPKLLGRSEYSDWVNAAPLVEAGCGGRPTTPWLGGMAGTTGAAGASPATPARQTTWMESVNRRARRSDGKLRLRPLLPAFRDSRCLVSKYPTPLDRGWIVDARRLPDQVSTLLQQRGGIRCSGTYRMRYLR
jgi:hypothetical protein